MEVTDAEVSFAPPGLAFLLLSCTHGWRSGLQSFAASRRGLGDSLRRALDCRMLNLTDAPPSRHSRCRCLPGSPASAHHVKGLPSPRTFSWVARLALRGPADRYAVTHSLR